MIVYRKAVRWFARSLFLAFLYLISCPDNAFCTLQSKNNSLLAPSSQITILAPAAGEIIPTGTYYTIQWTMPYPSAHALAKYSVDNGHTWRLIGSASWGSGDSMFMRWKIPIRAIASRKCLIKVVVRGPNSSIIDRAISTSPFTITPISIASPGKGVEISALNPAMIQWTTHKTKKPVDRFELRYTKNSGRTWHVIHKTVKGEGNPGGFLWDSIPPVDIPKTESRIEIVLKDASGNIVGKAHSDDFSITPPIEPPKPPVASFICPLNQSKDSEVTFDAGASFDEDGSIISYTFDFGDGSIPVTQNSPVFTHSYSAYGTFPVSLTVTDNDGLSNSKSEDITIGLILQNPVDIPTANMVGSISADEEGTIYVVWPYQYSVYFSRSLDGGQSFSEPKMIAYIPINAGYSPEQFSSSAAGAGSFQFAFTLFDEFYGGAEIFHMGTGDRGDSFTPPFMVSIPGGANSFGPSVATDGNGKVAITWTDIVIIYGNASGAYYAYSLDNGYSFSGPMIVIPGASAASIAVSPQYTFLSWMEGSWGNLYVARSTDNIDYSPYVGIMNNLEIALIPVLRLDSMGNLYLVRHERMVHDYGEIRFSRSTDNGLSFSPSFSVSIGMQEVACPDMSVGQDGNIYITWEKVIDPDVYNRISEIYLSFSSDRGMTFSPALKINIPSVGSEKLSCAKVVAFNNNKFGLLIERDFYPWRMMYIAGTIQ